MIESPVLQELKAEWTQEVARAYIIKILEARFGIAAGGNIPPSLLDVLGDDVPMNLERLLFCDRCTHGITFHGMFGCRFSRCRCTMSSSRLIAEALDETKPEGRDQPEHAGPRILHRYSTKTYPTKPSNPDC